jgi:uncharacterized protein
MKADVWYVDASALVKTVLHEPESPALAGWLRDKDRLAACDLIRVEAVRAVRLSNPATVARVRQAIATLVLLRLDDALYESAANLEPPLLRTLDALHLAAALSLGGDLAGLLTYDRHMAEGATLLGLRVEAPGRGELGC